MYLTGTMRKYLCLCLCFCALSAFGQQRLHVGSMSDELTQQGKLYTDSLQRLITRYRESSETEASRQNMVSTNPYYFPLFSTGILYNRPLHQSMGIEWEQKRTPLSRNDVNLLNLSDNQLVTLSGVNQQLVQMYMQSPGLFQQTQDQMMKEGELLTDVLSPIKTENKIVEQIQLSDIDHGVTDNIAAITRKPNFWTFKGSASLQFTQSYFSDNWYQGGDNNYAALSMFTLEANYDNKQKLQWENKLEAQLGFQTTKGDTCHSLKVTSNLLRLTSKLGYKAFKNWYYTARFQTYTQLYPNYKTNSYNVTTDFMSPMYFALSIGLDFKWKLKRFEGSLNPAPVEVNARYVDRKALRASYNDSERQATKWTWGPNVVVNYKWKIIDNIEWQGRLYWFTNFHYTNMEWENTFTFNVNKYLNCKLFVYPKYIDDKKYGKAKNDPERGYWMFKEWLSLGISYNW